MSTLNDVDQVALVTDGRFSGASHGIMVGHVTPEARDGGMIAIVQNGDIIRIDKRQQKIDLILPDAEIERRYAAHTIFTHTSSHHLFNGLLAHVAAGGRTSLRHYQRQHGVCSKSI